MSIIEWKYQFLLKIKAEGPWQICNRTLAEMLKDQIKAIFLDSVQMSTFWSFCSTFFLRKETKNRKKSRGNFFAFSAAWSVPSVRSNSIRLSSHSEQLSNGFQPEARHIRHISPEMHICSQQTVFCESLRGEVNFAQFLL